MTRSARLLIVDDREPSDEGVAFCAAIPTLVDGGARVVAAHRYCPANEDGPASATVLVHWGDGDELPEWGTHVLTYEADLGRHLLWQARYFDSFLDASVDLRDRMPAWSVVGRAVEECGTADGGRPRRSPAALPGARCDRRRRGGGSPAD